MKLANMKRTPKEKRDRKKDMQPSSPMDSDYHYGLRLHLGSEEMDKVGMKSNPKPGDVYEIHGHAKVTHAHESADENGTNRHVEMHFTHLGAKKSSDKSLREELEDAAKK